MRSLIVSGLESDCKVAEIDGAPAGAYARRAVAQQAAAAAGCNVDEPSMDLNR